jgi:four helix bundle protein
MSFSEKMIARTHAFALETVLFCRTLNSFPETKTIQYQLIKSSTSVAANYRAACRARSKKEWFAKISIVVEEIDESNFWLEIIPDLNLTSNKEKLKNLY